MSVQEKISQFLLKYRMNPETIDLKAETQTFVQEMQLGLTDKPGSLKMLCTYIQPEGKIPLNEPVIVIDAGGTNFRVALVTFDLKQNPVIEEFKTYPMPGTQGEISLEEFFKTLVNYLMPVINRSNRIGFCFSFPTVITPERDGVLLGFNKEVNVRGSQNAIIGEGLKAALKQAGILEDKQIVMLNDTVATLFGGKAATPGRLFSSYIGFILGTGTNACYIEQNQNIVKLPAVEAQAGSTIINIESGGYGKISQSEFDLRLDRKTGDPGAQKLEKMISGAYVGPLVLEMLRQAALDGLFTLESASRLSDLQQLSARDIDEFCLYPDSDQTVLGKCINGSSPETNIENQLTLYSLLDACFERAARIVAVNLAAVISKSGQGKNPCYPVLIAAEGTTFYKARLFRVKLDYYVRSFLNDQLGLYCEFVKAENATLVGTAIAGLVATKLS